MKNPITIIIVVLIIAVTVFVFIKMKTKSKEKLALKKQSFAEKKAKLQATLNVQALSEKLKRQKYMDDQRNKQWNFVING